MQKKFKIWQEKYSNEAGISLPTVSSHAIRGYSATYKLMETHDIKAVQADLGHTTADMTLNYYARINDDARQNLIKNFSERTYSADTIKKPDFNDINLEDYIIEQLNQNPEMKKSIILKLSGF